MLHVRRVAWSWVLAAAVPFVPLAAALAPSSASAQIAPGAAQVPPQRQLRELAPPPQPRLAPGLEAPPRPAAAPVRAAAGPVVAASVQGAEAIPAAELERLAQGLVGRAADPADIEAARFAILGEYRRRGFLFVSVTASAQPAPQPAPGGGSRLVFAVVEGRITRVLLDRDIGPAGAQVLRFLRGAVSPNAPATAARIERALLLAGEVPGVSVRGVIRPRPDGNPGELDLVAEVTRRPFSGALTADNRAFRLTGPVQFLLSAQANSFSALGERTEAQFFTSSGAEAVFGLASSEFFLGGSGLRLRLYAGAGRTEPSDELARIGFSGFTTVAGAAVAYPIVRRRSANLNVSAQFDLYGNTVDVGTDVVVRASRDNIRVFRGGLDGALLDTLVPFAAPATNFAVVRVSQGVDGLGSTRAGSSPGPSRSGSEFGFAKVTGEVQRNQPLFAVGERANVALQGLFSGQWSDDVLPASEKFFLGGTRLGRGFYLGQVSGDRAVAVALELQLNVGLPTFAAEPLGGRAIEIRPAAQLYAFYDAARTYENQATDPDRRVESWGAGARFAFNERFFVDGEVAQRLTRRVDSASTAVKPLPETAGFFRVAMRF